MKKILLTSFTILSLGVTSQLFAWGTTGHRVIAEIAQRNLNNKATKTVNDLFDNQSMAYWANWADFLKSDTLDTWKHSFVWHYVNIPANTQRADLEMRLNEVKQANVYSEIPNLIDILKNDKASKDEKKSALMFLIHLVGDLHQPMHTGRPGDYGGNKIKVFWFDREVNLHSLWDGTLVDFEKYSFTEYATVLNVLTDDQKEEMQKGTLEDWLYDSHTVANRIYDLSPNGARLSYDYNYIFRPVVNSQLQKAGLRLAYILNNL